MRERFRRGLLSVLADWLVLAVLMCVAVFWGKLVAEWVLWLCRMGR